MYRVLDESQIYKDRETLIKPLKYKTKNIEFQKHTSDTTFIKTTNATTIQQLTKLFTYNSPGSRCTEFTGTLFIFKLTKKTIG